MFKIWGWVGFGCFFGVVSGAFGAGFFSFDRVGLPVAVAGIEKSNSVFEIVTLDRGHSLKVAAFDFGSYLKQERAALLETKLTEHRRLALRLWVAQLERCENEKKAECRLFATSGSATAYLSGDEHTLRTAAHVLRENGAAVDRPAFVVLGVDHKIVFDSTLADEPEFTLKYTHGELPRDKFARFPVSFAARDLVEIHLTSKVDGQPLMDTTTDCHFGCESLCAGLRG